MLSNHLGILLGFIAGSYLSYKMMPLVSMIVPLLFFVGFYILPETPQYLLSREKVDEAEKALMFYRKTDPKNINKFTNEFDSIKKNLEKRVDVTTKLQSKDFS